MRPTFVHCLFEQSGTFKRVFKELGIPAQDYDIQNEFNETDNVVDLFSEIENGYIHKPSIFDNITPDHLIMAFFPCVCFTEYKQTIYDLSYWNIRNRKYVDKIRYAIDNLAVRALFHDKLFKLYYIVHDRGLKMVIENPANNNYLMHQNFPPPTLIDRNRNLKGDVFHKPTAYWFCSFEPCKKFEIYQQDKKMKLIHKQKRAEKAGMCSKERSMIELDYAKNFVHQYIIGEERRGEYCDAIKTFLK